MAKKPSSRKPARGSTGGSPDGGAARLLDAIAQKVERTIAQFLTAWRQRVERSREEELRRYMSAELENYPKLAEEFARRGADFEAVLTVFRARWKDFSLLLVMSKAAEEAVQEYQSWLKRYDGAIRLLTEEAAPFPEGVKGLLKGGYALFPRPGHVRDMLVQEIQKFPKDRPGGELLARNLGKSPGKMPAWMELRVELSELLAEKGVTKTQARQLVAQLFHALTPEWFAVKYAEDAIRHSGKRRSRA